MIDKYPIDIIKDVYSQKKYVTTNNFVSKLWAVFQFIGINIILYYFLNFFSDLNPVNRIEIGIIIMLSIFGFTSLMDGHSWAKVFEIIRCSLCLVYFILPLKWNVYIEFSQISVYLIVIFFIISLVSMFFISLPKKLLYAKS